MAGLGSENVTDERRVIVDSIAPGRSVNYGTPHIISADTATDKEYFSEGENVKLFYAEKAELKLTINEANFYAEDINTGRKRAGVNDLSRVLLANDRFTV